MSDKPDVGELLEDDMTSVTIVCGGAVVRSCSVRKSAKIQDVLRSIADSMDAMEIVLPDKAFYAEPQ